MANSMTPYQRRDREGLPPSTDRYTCWDCGEPMTGLVHDLIWRGPDGQDPPERVTICHVCFTAANGRPSKESR